MLDRSTPLPVKPFGKLALLPQTVVTLPNGITLHCCTGCDQPVSRLSLVIPGGHAEWGPVEATLFAEGLIQGTESLSAEEINNLIDYNGAKWSASPKDHHVVINLTMLNHRAAAIMPLLTEIVCHPTFPEERLEVKRLEYIAKVNTQRQRPTFIALESAAKLACGASHPLAQTITEAEIRAVSIDSLRERARRAINPATIHAYLSGSLTPELIDTAKAALSAIDTGAPGISPNIVPYTPAIAPQRLDIHHPDTLQTAVAIAFATPPRSHPDYIPLRYAVMALGGYFGSRLMSNIREEKGLTYGIDASLRGSLDGSYALIMASCDSAYTDTVIEEVDKELRRMVAEPPQGDELEHLRLFAATSLAEDLDSPFNTVELYSSEILVGTPPDYFERQLSELNALTPDTLAAMTQKYLLPNFALTVTAGSKKS